MVLNFTHSVRINLVVVFEPAALSSDSLVKQLSYSIICFIKGKSATQCVSLDLQVFDGFTASHRAVFGDLVLTHD